MKDVILKERKPSERLTELIDQIPELKMKDNFVYHKGYPVYGVANGRIDWVINLQSDINDYLKNSYKLTDTISNKCCNITEESFCDLLREHLYLTAKDKLAELLPQIQEHYPDATLEDDQILIMLGSDNPEWVAEIQNTQVVAGWGGSYGQSDIWKDADKLIVKAPKPWWETQDHFYNISLDYSGKTVRMVFMQCSLYTSSRNMVGKNAGKTMFKNREEAEVMCNKINAVLKGETC